jgi:hypothetical protein
MGGNTLFRLIEHPAQHDRRSLLSRNSGNSTTPSGTNTNTGSIPNNTAACLRHDPASVMDFALGDVKHGEMCDECNLCCSSPLWHWPSLCSQVEAGNGYALSDSSSRPAGDLVVRRVKSHVALHRCTARSIPCAQPCTIRTSVLCGRERLGEVASTSPERK